MYAFPFKELRLIALLCNVIVVTGGIYIYLKNGQVTWKKILSMVLFSVPMAYLGAVVRISQDVFFVILGCSLVIASILLWIKTNPATITLIDVRTEAEHRAFNIGGSKSMFIKRRYK